MFDLATLSLSKLVALFNSFADKPVTKFSDKESAVRRINAALEAKGLVIVELDGSVVAAQPFDLAEAVDVTETLDTEEYLERELSAEAVDPSEDADGSRLPAEAVVAAEPAVPATAPTRPVKLPLRVDPVKTPGRRGPAPAHADDDVITVLTPNHKRAGSASHARFALYRDGMTCAEYLQAASALQGGKPEKYRADLHWDSLHGFVGFYTARQWANNSAGRDIEDDGEA